MISSQLVCPLSTDYLSCDELVQVVDLTISSVRNDSRLNIYPSFLRVLSSWKRLAIKNTRTIELDLLYRYFIREVPTHVIHIFLKYVYRNLLSLRLYFHSSASHSYPNSLAAIDQLKNNGFFCVSS